MDASTFPFRLDKRTRKALSSLISIMVNQNLRIAAATGYVNLMFLEKGAGNNWPLDAPITFTRDGLQVFYPMNAVAKGHEQSLKWLQNYQRWLVGQRGPMDPVPERCSIIIEARFDGSLKYYFTYMTVHEDGSLAQDMPQGKLYHTESLFLIEEDEEPAVLASEPEQAQPAAWM